MKKIKVKIEVSARHCHLSQAHLDKLFGVNYQLKHLKALSQTGEFAAKERLTFKTKLGVINNLRVVGPVRDQTQIELSQTDARSLKIVPPLRLSGDIKESLGGVLIGPKGRVKLSEGIIIAKRHLHCSSVEAKKMGLRNNQKVKLEVSGERCAVLGSAVVRVKDSFNLAVHLDTDEANAVLPDGVCGMGFLLLK